MKATESLRLLCPVCGGETACGADDGFACEVCGAWLKKQPHGKAWILRPAERALPNEAQAITLVEKSQRENAPKKRRILLDQAFALCPDSLQVNRAVLMFGHLDQMDLRKPDNHCIKCYLLHMFDAPQEETDACKAQMLQELTADPQLLRCLSLAADKDAFLTDYCLELCRDYLRIFMKSDNSRNGTMMGFQIIPKEKALAAPVAGMMLHLQSAGLPAPFDLLMPQALRNAYEAVVGQWQYVEQAMAGGRR